MWRTRGGGRRRTPAAARPRTRGPRSPGRPSSAVMTSSITTMTSVDVVERVLDRRPSRSRSAAAAVLSASRPSDVAFAARASLLPSRLSAMADSRVSRPSMPLAIAADGIGRRTERRHAQDVDRPERRLERLEAGPHAGDRVGGRVDRLGRPVDGDGEALGRRRRVIERDRGPVEGRRELVDRRLDTRVRQRRSGR